MSTRPTRVLAAMVLAGVCAIAPRVVAQEPAAKDYNQRSLEIYEFRKAAKSGPERGGEIYYYKCWFCHNEFTKDIPKLEGLFKRATLLSGQPVTEENVKAKLREGGPGMPAYRSVLNDADLNDLTSYLREKCCWNSDAPPLNPRYIAR
jgi:cytochrome c5